MGREAARVFRASCAWFFFSPSVLFCGHTFLDARVGSLTEVGERVVLPTPRRSDSQGKAQSWAGALDAPFLGILSAYFVCQRVTGTLGRIASGTFSVGEGAPFCPLRSHFSHARFCFSPPQVFFLFFFFGLRGPRAALHC